MAKAVSDAANGGMIVLSDSTAGLLLGVPEVAALLAGEGTEVWHLGRVKLADDLRDVEMFQVVTPSLAPRLALQQPIRVKAQLLPGVLAAPAGNVALVRLHVSGLVLLRATDVMLAAEVAGVLESLLVESLPLMGGYLSEARQGGAEGITVAFSDCLRAVAWALAVQADMLHWNWSRELLSHEAFETISIDNGFGPPFSEHLYAEAEHTSVAAAAAAAAAAAVAAAEVPAQNSPSKSSRSRVYASPLEATATGIPPTSSFSSQVGKGVQPAAAGTRAVFASGGGLSFSSQAGRPQESGGSRIGMFASSFTASFISRGQRYLFRGPVSRKLVSDVKGPVPSLLSPLQLPTEVPVEAPKPNPADFEHSRKTPAKRLTLHGFRRWGSQQLPQVQGEDLGSPGPMVERGEGRKQADGGDVESGRMEGTEELMTVETVRPSSPGGTFPLKAIMMQPAAAAASAGAAEAPADDSIATGAAEAPADATGATNQVPIAEGLEDATVAAPDVNILNFSAAAAEAPPSPRAIAAAEDKGAVSWTAMPEASIAQERVPTIGASVGAAAAAAAAAELGVSPFTSTSRCGPRGHVGHKILFRGPRTKAVIDFGGVTPEICRTTGRLLYKGRVAKQLAKLMEAAQRGQVLCTAAVFAQAAGAAAQCGIAMTSVATPVGAGRRKALASNSRAVPGSSRAPSVAAPAPAALIGAGGSSALPPTGPTEVHESPVAVAATSRKAQYFLCTLAAPPLSPPLQDSKALPSSADNSFRTIHKAGDSIHIRQKAEL
ncbi:hypothetical protein Vretimale_333 [Volvox reticuliferus]|uniref:Uncharacterized protein n=1 Tax=Volvox reticuliferus TaxID=1737510 RepID=A0A8J4D3C8_9CHLO|nr:hypothetical protein Vretimale_333 [Volvox reticuliferus]